MTIDIGGPLDWAKGLVTLTRIITAKKEIKFPAWLKTPLFRGADRTLTKCLLPSNDDMDMVVGKANRQALSEGKESSLSRYLSFSHSQFDSFYGALNPSFNRKPQEYLDDDMLLHSTSNILLLGGPIANEGTIRLGGYEKCKYVNPEGKTLDFPVFKPRNGIALGFFCGDEGYGFRDGKQARSWRYESGEAREGAIFSVKDVRAKTETRFQVEDHDGKKFISEEGLLITRIPHTNSDAHDKSIVIVGGAHGFSAEAFAKDLKTSLAALNKITNGRKYYQVFVPCKITHDHTNLLSYGTLIWEHPSAIVLELSRDEL